MTTISNSYSTVHTERIRDNLSRLRPRNVDYLLVAALLIWMLYLVSGFRPPTQAIQLSDSNSGSAIRQLIFAGTGMLALSRMFFSRTIGAALVINTPMVLVAGLLFFSVVWSAESNLTIKRSIIFLFGLVSLIVAVHSSKKPASLMLHCIVYFTAIISALSLLFHIALPAECTVNPARPGLAGISNHPNTLAPFLSIGLILSFAIPSTSKVRKWKLRIASGILAVGLLLTFSMTTLMTTLFGIAIYAFLSTSNYKRGILQIVIIGTCILVSIIGLTTIKSTFFGATGRDESLSGRDELWSAVWAQYKKDPITGNGYGAFWTEGKGRELVQTWNPRQSHNAYLDVLIDLGAVGLLLIVIIFPLRIFSIWRQISGPPGSQLRRVSSAYVAVAVSYMTFYAFAQSFFFRFDSFPFFAIVWLTLLLTNRDSNNLIEEFSQKAL